MNRLLKVIKALFDDSVHVLTEQELLQHEVEAAQIGYDVARRDYNNEVMYSEYFVNGVKVQTPIN